jgi:excisionase family DNA binding protein
MDLESAARVLQVHYQTAYRWVRMGLLPAVKVGSQYELDASDVAEFAGRSAPRVTLDGGGAAPVWVRELSRALVAGDEHAARSLIAAVHESGLSPLAVCERVIAPAIRDVVERRRSGSLSAAEGVMANAICEQIVGALTFPPQGRPRGVAVVAGPEGDRHRLPGLLAVVALRGDRWRVHDLGADVPTQELIEFVRDGGVDLVVLPVPDGHPGTDGLRTAIEAVTAAPVLSHDGDGTLGDLVTRAQRITGHRGANPLTGSLGKTI